MDQADADAIAAWRYESPKRFAPARFRLSVATFNEGAIRVYERRGFQPGHTYDHATNGGIHPFLEMTRPV
jgi:ribosomal-protein-alanine N-acetyltransferase